MTKIGVIGGMGPRATVEFERLIIDQFIGIDQDIPPLVTINDGRIPDRSSYLLGNGENPTFAIQRCINDLARIGVDVFCMPCNTAHAPQIIRQLDFYDINLVHMPKLVADHVASNGCKRVAIFATEGTIVSQLYQSLCAQRGILCVAPPKSIQNKVDEVILLVKSGQLALASISIKVINDFIKATGVDAIILGCTELTLVKSYFDESFTAIDTMELLAKGVATYNTTKQEHPIDTR